MSDQSTAPVLEPESPFKPIPVGRSQNRNIPNCYWKKAAHEGAGPGWIIVGPGLETVQADQWRKAGRIPFPEYSLTDRVSSRSGMREPIEYAEDQLARFRYYWFFKNGGAKEFTVEQIVEHHWHITPPYGLSVEVFPQLAEYDLPAPLWCSVCPPDAPPKNSPAQLIQHGMIAHRLGLPEARHLLEDAREPPKAGGLAPIIRRKEEMTPEAVAERKAFAEKAAAEAGEINVRGSGLQVCHSCGVEIAGALADHQCSPSNASPAAD